MSLSGSCGVDTVLVGEQNTLNGHLRTKRGLGRKNFKWFDCQAAAFDCIYNTATS